MIDFDRAISLNPGNEMPYVGRAQAYERDRNYASARADLSRAIEINPLNLAAWEHRGILSYVEGKYKDAVKDLSRAIELDPNNPRALSFRGNAYAALNEIRKGAGRLYESHRSEPKGVPESAWKGVYLEK